MSARSAALLAVAAVVLGVAIYLLVNVPFFYAACGVVALVMLLAAVGGEGAPQ